MIYFIGGPPRVGKSILAGEVSRRRGIRSVSTDSLGAVLESVVGPEEAPGLFAVSRFNEMPETERVKLLIENPTRRIAYQVEESTAVWRAVEPFVRREQEEGRELVVEGVAVLPRLVDQLVGVDYRAVFLGNQAAVHNIRKSANENELDWMRHAGGEFVEAFAAFVSAMSRSIEEEARRYGFAYLDLDGRPFEDAVAQAVDLFLE